LGEPLLVRFDEGNWLLKEWSYSKSPEELLYQARNDDVIGREWAVRELGRFPGVPEVEGVLTALAKDDPFWAVRVAAIEMLAIDGGPQTLETITAAARDENSRVRRTAIRLLGERSDPALSAFFRDRFAEDDSYQVQAEALRAIGRIGDRSQLLFLEEALEMPSPRDVIREAAEWAIETISKDK